MPESGQNNRSNPRANLARAAWAILAVLGVSALLLPFVLAQNGGSGDREGWFSEEQAERGRTSYLENCARCHSRDLNARATYISLYRYPALRGAYFMDRWEGENVRSLFQVIRHTMPLDAPGTLDAETYADITAYILQENGFPSGGPPLPTERSDPERLRGLVMEPTAMVERPQPQQPGDADLTEAQEPPEPEPEAQPAAETGETEDETPAAAEEQPNDGAWFTEEQAVRGDELFVEHCSRCHGRALQGVGVAPSLAGGNFIARWEGESVGELFRIISSLMPLDGQGELDPQTYADLTAYILWENGFPTGDVELSPDYERLQDFEITPELAEVPEVQ